MKPWDWGILNGSAEWRAAGAPLKGALWTVERPQQAFFNPVREGSRKFWSTMTQLNNAVGLNGWQSFEPDYLFGKGVRIPWERVPSIS